MESGTLCLDSDAAADILTVWHRLRKLMQRPLILEELPEDYFEKKKEHYGVGETTEGELIKEAVKDFYRKAQPYAKARWGERLARIPWTTQEVKRQIKSKYSEEERRTIGLLAEEGSTACKGYELLGLNRALIKKVMKSLQDRRMWQVCFASIICATKNKFFDKSGNTKAVKCPNGCGQMDSLECYAGILCTHNSAGRHGVP